MLARRLVVAVALLVLVAAGIGLWGAHAALTRPYAGWDGDSVEIELEPGLDAGAMLDRLAERGVLRHTWLLGGWLRYSDRTRSLHAGEYRFDRPASALEVVARLESGDVLLHPFTVPEGLTLVEVAAQIAETGLWDAEALRAAFRDPAPIADLDPAAEDLEGYLFPDTYSFPRSADAAAVARRMVGRFREVAGAAYREEAAALGLALREAVTLASMIEEETSLPGERGRISRVFHNRLARDMRLQCDPTVRYALLRDGRPVGRLTYKDLEYDSPWNTYVAVGLPPGPIANPGLASLEAALRPTPGDDLFFVAAPGGGHRFSVSLAAHEQAVAEWRSYSRSSSR